MAWMVGMAVGAGLGALSSATDDGSGDTSTQTQGTNSQAQSTWAPHSQLTDAYGNLISNVNALSGTAAQYYPGQGYVGPSDYTQQGVANMGNIYNQAMGNYGMLSNAADVANNPYVQGQLQANERSVMNTLTNQALPQLQSGAQQVNALGSSRLGLAQGQALGDASEALANSNASTMLNAYGQGLGAQQNALGQTGSMLTNALAQGQTVEGYQQKALEDAMARWEWQYNEPWQRAQNTSSILSSLSGLGTNYSTSGGTSATDATTTSDSDTASSILGGAATGASLGYKFK
jgi:hypothetical protein